MELVPIDKSFFTLRYVLDGGCGGCGGKGGGCDGKGGGDGKGGCGNTVDTINFNIHSTRIDRLRSLYKKNNKENYNENHFFRLFICMYTTL